MLPWIEPSMRPVWHTGAFMQRSVMSEYKFICACTCAISVSVSCMYICMCIYHSITSRLSLYKATDGFRLRLRSYHGECTGSRPLSEVKLRWAGVVLWWETTRERPVLQALIFYFFFPLLFRYQVSFLTYNFHALPVW